jgi:integrase
VPLHSALVPSFRRYVRQVERDGHDWVFHRWSRTPTQPRSSPIVTTFGTYLRKHCGITDRRVVLHSLRHTVKQRLQEAGAPDSLISDLLGHAGSGETNATYGEAATVSRMAEWIERLPIANVLGQQSSCRACAANCPSPHTSRACRDPSG